uniref:Uncharacterized protein n=1 Tax=Ascaris lumbricoides TaxID=6252 RepID=A0A9J2PNY4_ASCLU
MKLSIIAEFHFGSSFAASLPIEEDSFWKKGDTILMHHQSIRNRRLKITLDTEMSLGECKKCVINANGAKQLIWMVPCDMTGLSDDVVNGIKPQKRPIRIRVHPETLKMAETNNEIAISLIEEMLGADWSLSAPSLPDVRIQHVQQLRKLFASIKGRITHLNDCVIISWAFDKSSEFGNLSSSSVLSAFSLKVVTQPSSDENHSINDIQSQLVALRFIRENICEPLLQLHFIDSHEPKWLKIDRKDHCLELDERGFRMVLCRSNCDASCVPFRICGKIHAFYFDENGDTKEMGYGSFLFVYLGVDDMNCFHTTSLLRNRYNRGGERIEDTPSSVRTGALTRSESEFMRRIPSDGKNLFHFRREAFC